MRRLIVLLTALLLPAAVALAAGPIEGKYRANGKDATLNFLFVQKGEPAHDMPTEILIFSEKDASHDGSPVAHAREGAFGDALVVTLYDAPWGWDALNGYLYHAGLEGSHRMDTAGTIKGKDIKLANGVLAGRLVTDPGEAIEVDLKFQAKLP